MKNAIAKTFGISLLAVGVSQAALISGVTVQSFSAENGGFGRFAVDTVNGSGMSGLTPGVMGGVHNNNAGDMWQIGNVTNGTGNITYDLGAIYSLDSFQVWNFNEVNLGPARSVRDVVVTYGETLALGSTLGSVTQFAAAPGTNNYAGQVFTFAPISARFVRIESLNNYGGDRVGLAEIQFNSAPAATVIPEPSSAVLLGIGGLALVMLRRK